MTIVFLTGFISLVVQYMAMIVLIVFVVDFFSYRSRKALIASIAYFITLPAIHLIVANLLLQMLTNGTLRQRVFEQCYHNILLSFTIHIFFGLLIFCFSLKNIASGIISLAANLRNYAHN